MEDEIEIGEYGRTNFGEIIKFAWLEDSEGKTIKNKVILINRNKVSNDFYYFHGEENIVKHSKQLIDLIEVGDFVNGYKVISVDYDVMNDTTECIELDLNSNYQYNFISIRQIKTILTKEQYNINCYKVGGEDE